MRYALLLIVFSALTEMPGGNASAGTGRIDVASCEAADVGWLREGIVRDVDKAQRELILDYGPTAVGAGIEQDAANKIEYAIRHALNFYRTGLRPQGRSLDVPSSKPWENGVPPPPRMLCISEPDTDVKKYVIFPDTISKDTLGEYRAPGPVLGGVPDIRIDPTVILAFQDLARGNGKVDSEKITTPAHELFHAIEAAHPMFTNPMLQGCKEYGVCPAHWVSEGIADAMAYAWLRKYETGVLGNRPRIKYNRQLPYLDLPLHKAPDNSDEAYAVSLFWEYLAWEPRYVRNEKDHRLVSGTLLGLRPDQNKAFFDPRLILRFMNMDAAAIAKYSSASNRKGAWELEWLDHVLRDALVEARKDLSIEIPRDPKGGLFVVYPKYAAWLVAHQTNGRSNAQINARLGELFMNGCLPVTVVEDFDASVSLEIPDLATACVALLRPNVSDQVDISLEGTQALRDRIHIGWNGEVIPPHKKGNRTAKRWTVGLPLGQGTPSPTAKALILAISNVPEDTTAISAQPYDAKASVSQVDLTFRIR